MRIKLIAPRMSLRPMDSEFKRLMAPSLALLTLAALTPPEHSVRIEDENAGKLRLDDRPDLVGITVNVDTAYRAYEIADLYRCKGCRVILGGIHASANPEEALGHADSVCIGEAESLWATILADCENGRLKPRYHAAEAPALDACPAPRWDLIDTRKYLYTNVLFASRGCPYQCDFCYNSGDYVHKAYRNKPVEQVLAEIERLGTRHVMFIDDNFIGNPAWTREFVKAAQPLGLKWNAAVSANIIEYPDLLYAMRDSGCQSLFVGFESINEESNRSVGKHQNKRAKYEELIRALHDRGIMINASLVLGFDHDRPGVFEETLAWLIANKIETMTAHILTPYPGTRLFKRFAAEGRIIDWDWRHYNTSHVVFQPMHLTPDELRAGYLWLYDRFYSLASILARLPADPRQRVPYLLFNLGYRKFGRLTSRVGHIGLMHALGRLAGKLSYGV